ncbi:MAG: hypothetical protein KBS81_09070 [Spirochaetales bacterium]|nr:hypothetical protein [Candidatus Physcosoma equi]
MKKIIGLLLVALMLFCFVSCDLAQPGEKEEDTTFTGIVYVRKYGTKTVLASSYQISDDNQTWSDLDTSEGVLREEISVPGLDNLSYINRYYGANLMLSSELGTSSIEVYDAQHNLIPVDTPLLKYIYIDF